MKAWLHHNLIALGQHLGPDKRASQLAEFAISLPLLVVFVVGIFDFGGAFTLKQKLSNAAREGARAAAAAPASDVGNSSAAPVSVSDAFQVVDNYLLGENINDCGLKSSSGSGPNLIWTYHATLSGPPVCDLKLIINRGCTTQITGESTVYVIDTCVTIEYAYNWRFNNVIGLLGGSLTLPTKLTTTAVAFNED